MYAINIINIRTTIINITKDMIYQPSLFAYYYSEDSKFLYE